LISPLNIVVFWSDVILKRKRECQFYIWKEAFEKFKLWKSEWTFLQRLKKLLFVLPEKQKKSNFQGKIVNGTSHQFVWKPDWKWHAFNFSNLFRIVPDSFMNQEALNSEDNHLFPRECHYYSNLNPETTPSKMNWRNVKEMIFQDILKELKKQ
jgi:hypothetical protein